MAIHQRVPFTIPAGGAIANALTGLGIEFMGRASAVKLYGTVDTAGPTIGLSYTMGGDSRVLIPAGSPLPAAAAAGQGPKQDEDFMGEWPVPQGAHLVLSVAGVAAITGRFAIDVTP